MDAGGFVVKKSHHRRRTTSPEQSGPIWSPDGSRIVFAGASEEGFDLYVMNADGTDIDQADRPPRRRDPTGVVAGRGPDRVLAGTTSGTRGAGRGSRSSNADGYGVDGAREPQANEGCRVSDVVPGRGADRVHHNVTRGAQLYVMDPDGADITELRPEQPDPRTSRGWTPDGRIVFRGVLDRKERFLSMQAGWLGRADGRSTILPLDGRLVLDWSPDGRWIVLSAPWQIGRTSCTSCARTATRSSSSAEAPNPDGARAPDEQGSSDDRHRPSRGRLGLDREISVEELQLSQRNHGMHLEGLRYDVTPAGMHYLLIHFDVPEADEADVDALDRGTGARTRSSCRSPISRRGPA